jgi:hypothetical protein
MSSEPLHERAYVVLRDALRRGQFTLDRSVPQRRLSEEHGQ